MSSGPETSGFSERRGRMRSSSLASAVAALLGLGLAAPSSNHVGPRQSESENLKNCTKPFFEDVIRKANLVDKVEVADNSPYTSSSEPYAIPVLYYANHNSTLNVPDICGARIKVKGTKNVAFELYLPSRANWNMRFLTVGNGAFAGGASRVDMFSRAVYGWATMSTNTGHENDNSSLPGLLDWAKNEPDLQKDWAYRAMAQSVPYAKAIVAGYYEGISMRGNYYSGCSTGGRQGIRQIEEDPNSFDGMLIGAPAWNIKSFVGVISRIGWLAETSGLKDTDTDPFLTFRIKETVYNICNGLDGSITDEAVRDMDKCRTALRGSSTNETLWRGSFTTVAQREAFLTLIEEFKSPVDDTSYAGDGFEPTAAWDLGFSTYLSDRRRNGDFTNQFAKYFLNDTSRDLVWDDSEHGKRLLGDLTEWNDRVRAQADPILLGNGTYKGKTILYTGTSDGFVSSIGTRRAYDIAGGNSNNNLAYFEIPGMPHCVDLGTGASKNPPWYIGAVGLYIPAPNNVYYMPNNTGLDGSSLFDARHDALTALAEWHENNRGRPDSIIATAFSTWGDGKFEVSKQRPICRFPLKQNLKNETNVNKAEGPLRDFIRELLNNKDLNDKMEYFTQVSGLLGYGKAKRVFRLALMFVKAKT
ncbi:hypothetical protein OQA88_618 [Cercophora sp. LCS_1]